MPEPVRNLVFDPEDVKMMNKILNSNKIVRLEHLQNRGENFLRGWLSDLVEISQIGGRKAVKQLSKPIPKAAIRRGVGSQVINPLVDTFNQR